MPNYLVLSKITTEKAPAKGGGTFQKHFWENFSEPAEYLTRRESLYAKRATLNLEKKFFKVDIDKRGKTTPIAKTNVPTTIWEETGLQIAKKSDNHLILHGERLQMESLFSVIQNATYTSAKRNSGKKKTLLDREVFTLQEIKNIPLEERLSPDIILSPDDERLDVMLELYSKYKYQEGQSLYNRIKTFVDIKQGEVRSYVGIDSEIIQNVCIRIHLTKRDIVELIETIPEIQYGYKTPKNMIQRSRNGSIHIEIQEREFQTDIVVGLFDQGVANILQFGIFHRENLVDHTETDHGTAVASKILFGRQLNHENMPVRGTLSLTPTVKILDIKILNANGGVDDPNALYSQIEEIVNKYTQIYIYNLSIGFPQEKQEGFIHMLTSILDSLAHKYDKIFIISAGNADIYRFLQSTNNGSYIDALEHVDGDRSHIEVFAPGDAINGITVGSIVEIADTSTIAKTRGEISPVSRVGMKRNGRIIRKPDVVEFGSNHKYADIAQPQDDEHYGALVINTNGQLEGTRGTSFSAPMIANMCAKILDFFEKTQIHDRELEGNRLNLIKGLLLHKTAIHNQTRICEDLENMFYGYGQPGNIESILEDPISTFTFVHFNKIELIDRNQTIEKVHTIPFQLLGIEPNKELTICATLCYNPPVNKDFPTEYSQIVMKSSVKINGKDITPSKYHYRHKEDQSPIKVFSFSHRNWTGNDTIKIRLQTMVSDFFLKRLPPNYEQPYALFVSIIDPSGDINLRELMLQQTEVFEVIQPIQIPIQTAV